MAHSVARNESRRIPLSIYARLFQWCQRGNGEVDRGCDGDEVGRFIFLFCTQGLVPANQNMKEMIQFRYVWFILLGMLTLHACSGQSADSSASTTSKKGGWLVNVNEAQSQSIKENKPILVYFTNTDTCGLCKQMDTNVFSTPTFKDWAEQSVVLLKVDFSKIPEGSNEQYSGMAHSLKVNEYPTTWILSITHEPENNRFKVKPIGKIAYQQTPEKFIGMLQNLVRK